MNNASFVRNDYAIKPSSQVVTAVSRPAPNKNGQVRPSSAPAKRPQSPNLSSTNNTS